MADNQTEGEMCSIYNYCVQLTECCPHQCLEWLSTQVVRNKTAASWTLQHLDFWVETYLMSYGNVRVRNGTPRILNLPAHAICKSYGVISTNTVRYKICIWCVIISGAGKGSGERWLLLLLFLHMCINWDITVVSRRFFTDVGMNSSQNAEEMWDGFIAYRNIVVMGTVSQMLPQM